MRIGQVLCTFPYSMVLVNDGHYSDNMLTGSRVPRSFMEPMETHIFASAKRQRDNKTAAVWFESAAYNHENHNPNLINHSDLWIGSFYDSNTTLVSFPTWNVVGSYDTGRLKEHSKFSNNLEPHLPKNVVQGHDIVLVAVRYAIANDCTINVDRDPWTDGYSFTRAGESYPCAIYEANKGEFMAQDKLDARNAKLRAKREAWEAEDAARKAKRGY